MTKIEEASLLVLDGLEPRMVPRHRIERGSKGHPFKEGAIRLQAPQAMIECEAGCGLLVVKKGPRFIIDGHASPIRACFACFWSQIKRDAVPDHGLKVQPREAYNTETRARFIPHGNATWIETLPISHRRESDR